MHSIFQLTAAVLAISFLFIQFGPYTRAEEMASQTARQAMNVLGQPLKCCCTKPKTGFYRDGYCQTGPNDYGAHVVCARVTSEFLEYTAARGNDLATPFPPHFPGLKPGDRWCLCASRWKEALDAGVAPPIYLDGCHEKALQYVTMSQLREFALTGDDAVEGGHEADRDEL